LTGQNSYPLREWHTEHMQKTIIKYVIGISENNATNFQKRLHKRYNGNLTYVCKNIGFDIKHGVINDQVLMFIDKVKSDPIYANTQQNTDCIERLEINIRFIIYDQNLGLFIFVITFVIRKGQLLLVI
jgi:hypothetical protein